MPTGGDVRLYDGRRDFANQRDASQAFYDLCRDSGIPADKARVFADKGADQFIRNEEKPTGESAPVATSQRRARIRVRFPWESPDAGIDL